MGDFSCMTEWNLHSFSDSYYIISYSVDKELSNFIKKKH